MQTSVNCRGLIVFKGQRLPAWKLFEHYPSREFTDRQTDRPQLTSLYLVDEKNAMPMTSKNPSLQSSRNTVNFNHLNVHLSVTGRHAKIDFVKE